MLRHNYVIVDQLPHTSATLEEKMTLEDVLKNLYIHACLDAIQEKNKGKGKELCAKRIDHAHAQIKSLMMEMVGESKKCYCNSPRMDVCEFCGPYNQAKQEIRQRIKEA